MPFKFDDEKENIDGLPDGVSLEDFRMQVAAMVADGVGKMVQEAVDEQRYITQESGLRVWRFTGKIVDEPEGGKG